MWQGAEILSLNPAGDYCKFLLNRRPLSADPGPIDFRECRTLAGALRFDYHQQ